VVLPVNSLRALIRAWEGSIHRPMQNRYILDAVKTLWAGDASPGKKLLDLSCGDGHSARMLAVPAHRWWPPSMGPSTTWGAAFYGSRR
jgi:hypothetical protein